MDEKFARINEFKAAVPDQVEAMMLWEQDELSNDETIALFQSLIDSGLVWQLQGAYGRAASRMLELGLCKIKG